MVRQRVRIRFRKQGDLRFLGHRDLARSFERLFRRAGLKLRRSQGFHPKPKISFPSALSVGIEGLDEIVELELAETMPEVELLAQLNACAVSPLEFLSVETLMSEQKKAKLQNATYHLNVPEEHLQETADAVDRFLAASSVSYRRPGKTTSVDLRPLVETLRLTSARLEMCLALGQIQGAGVRDVLAVLGLKSVEAQGSVLARSRVEIAS